MTSENIRNLLLSRGYFPKELPNTFTTQGFGALSGQILAEWSASGLIKQKIIKKIQGKKKRAAYQYELKDADPEVISKPKRGYERRNIHITHPLPQALLAHEIAQGWRDIQKWLSRSKFTEDVIAIGEKHDRGLEEINFVAHRAKKSFLEASSDWMVTTDISRFYPSIYTHSIPWAAYGKEKVKANLSTYNGSLADRLDILVRSCNRNQTIGIPIGPESSRILAEIISSRIDNDLCEILKSVDEKRIDRLQDDWSIGTDSLSEAERQLSALSITYRNYGLEINGSKTTVAHILASRQDEWHSELNAFLSHHTGDLKAARLREFLAIVLRLQVNNASAPVLNYALAVIEKLRPDAPDTEAIESFLLKAAAIGPAAMDRICRIILNLNFKSAHISKTRISARFTELAARATRNGNLYEAIWLLHTIRGLKIPLQSRDICELSETTSSSALALILLDLKSKRLCPLSLPTATWERRIDEESISRSWIWLLAYEGIRKGWLRDPSNIIQSPLMKPMADRDIVFYDPTKNITNSKKIAKDAFKKRKQQSARARHLMAELRMFHPSHFLNEY